MSTKRPQLKSRKAKPGPQALYILSDSTGNLARHMLSAFLTQFPPDAFLLHWRPFLQTHDKLEATLAEIAKHPGMVFHAVVAPDAKSLIETRCRAAEIPVCDLTGSFVHFIEEHSGLAASGDYSKLHPHNALYHARIRAMEYTLEHDDGLGLPTLHKADIVLTGVSRTSKTPTSIYLAQQGYRVANVALALGVDPPEELLKLHKGKAVGLTINPHKLADIRTRRAAGWQMGDSAYNDPEMIQEEITWSRRLFARQGWPVLDVTDYAIEETAARVLELLRLNPSAP